MRLGIDFVSLALVLVGFVVAQLQSIPIRLRYFVVAASCGAVAVYRLRLGAKGVNLAFVAIAAVLALLYLVRGMRARR